MSSAEQPVSTSTGERVCSIEYFRDTIICYDSVFLLSCKIHRLQTSALLGKCEESGACLVGDSEPLHLESLLCAVLYLH